MCFFDAVSATEKLHTVPEEDLLRVLGAYIPEKLRAAAVDMVNRLEKPDWCILIACISNGFHGGYANGQAEAKEGFSLHQSYLDARRPQQANGATHP